MKLWRIALRNVARRHDLLPAPALRVIATQRGASPYTMRRGHHYLLPAPAPGTAGGGA